MELFYVSFRKYLFIFGFIYFGRKQKYLWKHFYIVKKPLKYRARETLYVLLKGKFEKVWTKNLSHRKMEGDILTDGLISLGSIKKLIRHNILACSPKEP